MHGSSESFLAAQCMRLRVKIHILLQYWNKILSLSSSLDLSPFACSVHHAHCKSRTETALSVLSFNHFHPMPLSLSLSLSLSPPPSFIFTYIHFLSTDKQKSKYPNIISSTPMFQMPWFWSRVIDALPETQYARESSINDALLSLLLPPYPLFTHPHLHSSFSLVQT